ncbi:hypothetical protein Q9L58_009766 [Maublancomyces gigas]|uniref:Uncharacterized protein n=1 Tax=Discina gigas TaxID=1032678 RepID=A0ABR3G6N8_9PEZI
MPPRMKRVSATPLLLDNFYVKSALTYLTKQEVFASFKEHFHNNRSDINNPERSAEQVYNTYLSYSPPAPPTPAAPIPTPIASSSTAGSLLTGWSPTPLPQTPLSTFMFRLTRGGLSQSSSRNRSKSPTKRSRASSPSPDPPGPDEMVLSSTTTTATADGSTPDASLIAQDLTATQAQVLSLTNTLRSRGSAPAPTKQSNPPSPPPAPKATKPSFAAVPASGLAAPSNQWQTATKKAKKVRPEPLFKPDYTKVNRELIIELSSPIPPGVSDYAIITAANKALASTEVVFCLTRRTTRGNIILLTRPNVSASSAEAYSSILAASLQTLGCTPSSTHANSRWTKFLVHGVPTSTSPSQMAEEISATYPTLPTLAQTPHWLTTLAAQAGKTSSTMVIALPVSCNMQNLGLRSLTLFNTICRLELYLQITPPRNAANARDSATLQPSAQPPPHDAPSAPVTTSPLHIPALPAPAGPNAPTLLSSAQTAHFTQATAPTTLPAPQGLRCRSAQVRKT